MSIKLYEPTVSKVCKDCGETKEICKENFYERKDRVGQFSHLCKPCHNNRNKKNASKLKQSDPDRFQKRRYAKHLQRTYGLHLEEYLFMLEKQNGVCYICNKQQPIDKVMFVDHCHKTGKVRSLLCQRCNSGIGYFNDDIDLMSKAIDYLKEHSHD